MTSFELWRHNQTVLDNLEPGDRLQFERGLYDHWAVYIGNKEVVHVTGLGYQRETKQNLPFSISGVGFDGGIICKDAFWDVVGDSKAYKNNSKDSKLKPYEPYTIVQRALSRVGEAGYNMFFKNCEHFASWCRYGKEESDQANGALAALAVGAVTALTVGGSAALVGLSWAVGAWLGSGGMKNRERPSKD